VAAGGVSHIGTHADVERVPLAQQNVIEEKFMAGSILQKSSEREREVSRRPEEGYEYAYGPFSLMRRFSEEMDQFFHNTFGRLHAGGITGWAPAVDVKEHDGNLEVVAELPGLRKEDVHVECTDDGLIIEGEKREEKVETQGGVHRSERSYGHFHRTVPLPAGAQTDKAQAEFHDGLLTIRIPVPENKQKRRSIPIAA
jgi:HSP20 family protein